MSRKGNYWLNCKTNAVLERLFLNLNLNLNLKLKLKIEQVWQKDYANHAAATNDVADYIVGLYNSIKLHSKLSNLVTPHTKLSNVNRHQKNYPTIRNYLTTTVVLYSTDELLISSLLTVISLLS